MGCIYVFDAVGSQKCIEIISTILTTIISNNIFGGSMYEFFYVVEVNFSKGQTH